MLSAPEEELLNFHKLRAKTRIRQNKSVEISRAVPPRASRRHPPALLLLVDEKGIEIPPINPACRNCFCKISSPAQSGDCAQFEALVHQSFIRVSLPRYSPFTDSGDTRAQSRNFQSNSVEKVRFALLLSRNSRPCFGTRINRSPRHAGGTLACPIVTVHIECWRGSLIGLRRLLGCNRTPLSGVPGRAAELCP